MLAPLSLDPALYPPAPLDGPPTAGLIGTADWPPTADAIRTLLEDVWPRVGGRRRSARLVVGRPRHGRASACWPARSSRRATSSRASRCCSIPLGRGSGMKVKVLEAMASGVPVVTTPAGAEGIEPSDGVVVLEEPAELAAAAVELLTTRGAPGARAGRAGDFERRYAPGPATEPLVELYRRMARLARRAAQA